MNIINKIERLHASCDCRNISCENIADALNIKKRQDGYLKATNINNYLAFGHLLELYNAKDYDENTMGDRYFSIYSWGI